MFARSVHSIISDIHHNHTHKCPWDEQQIAPDLGEKANSIQR